MIGLGDLKASSDNCVVKKWISLDNQGMSQLESDDAHQKPRALLYFYVGDKNEGSHAI